MTLDESFQVAVQCLDQQGQLLNGQLLRLLNGDKEAFREIRARLISEGFAEERFGVGLGRLEKAPPTADFPHSSNAADQSVNESSSQNTELSSENQSDADWYLMACGVVQGPITFDSLCEMRIYGEIQPADVVRKGTYGFWQRPDDVPELAAIKPNQRNRSPKIPVQEQAQAELPISSKGASGLIPPGSKQTTDEPGFYFWESGRSIGPVSRTELLDRLKSGRLSRDEFVRAGIDGEWQPVSVIVAESNLVTSIVDKGSVERSNEPIQQLEDDRYRRNRDFRADSLRTTPSSPSVYRATRKQVSPATPSKLAGSQETVDDERQRSDLDSGSLSDVDIELPEARPRSASPTPSAPVSTKRLATTRPAASLNTAPVEPLKAQSRFSTSAMIDVWRRVSKAVGGEQRLSGILAAIAVVLGAYWWIRQPPSANTIYQEFQRYHGQIAELKTRGVNDHAQWKRDVAQALSRTQSLVTGLKDPKTGASSLRPAKQELLWAGQDSLLKLLESPNIDPQKANGFEEQFEYHMEQARRLIDGGTRSLPKEFSSQSKRPDDSGPPKRVGGETPPGPPIKPAAPTRP